MQSLETKAQQWKREAIFPEEISNAATFFSMSYSEKRASLRVYGCVPPRPREGQLKVDALLLNLMDIEVAYEVMRRLGETNGNYEEAAMMKDNESCRSTLTHLYKDAYNMSDFVTTRRLSDEMNHPATMCYDPTDPIDAEIYERFGEQAFGECRIFDIEEWYWEKRKVMYGIIA